MVQVQLDDMIVSVDEEPAELLHCNSFDVAL